MLYKKLYDGKKVPVIGLGTWTMGGEEQRDTSRDKECIYAIKKALEIGYTLIDTAEMYGAGHTEELVGIAIEGFNREKLFITSKVWSTNLKYDDVFRSFDGSLRRMKIDYIDLYLIHWPNPEIPMEETFRALNKLADQGLVRYVGVSNFDVEQMIEAQKLSSTPLACNQVEYNILHREPEKNGVLDFCQKNGMILTTWKPLDRKNVLANRTIIRVARKYNATPAQIALNWLIRKENVVTIPMSLKEVHLWENFNAADLKLEDIDLKLLDELEKEQL